MLGFFVDFNLKSQYVHKDDASTSLYLDLNKTRIVCCLLVFYVFLFSISLVVTILPLTVERRTSVAPPGLVVIIVIAAMPWLAAIIPIVVEVRVAPVIAFSVQGTLMVLTAPASLHSYDRRSHGAGFNCSISHIARWDRTLVICRKTVLKAAVVPA